MLFSLQSPPAASKPPLTAGAVRDGDGILLDWEESRAQRGQWHTPGHGASRAWAPPAEALDKALLISEYTSLLDHPHKQG